jgi:hypothetical protein
MRRSSSRGGNVRHLAVAWFASAFAFSIAFIAWMFISLWLDGRVWLVPSNAVHVGLFGFSACLIFQFAYGSLTYFMLSRAGIWSVWTVLLAYLLPVVLFSWSATDTTQDILGTIPWLVFAVIVGFVTWIFGPRVPLHGATEG